MNKANLQPSPELAYLLAAVLGDGHFYINKRNHVIGFDSTEEQLMQAVQENFAKILEFTPKYRFEKRIGYSHGGIYRMRFGCLPFYNLVSNYELVTKVALSQPAAFLAGMFDTEGSTDVLLHHFPRAFIFNTEIPLINLCHECLRALNIEYHTRKREYPQDYIAISPGRLITNKLPSYRIGIISRDMVNRFISTVMIPYCRLERKKQKMLNAPRSIPKQRKEYILNNRYQKSVSELSEATGLKQNTIRVYFSKWKRDINPKPS